MEWQISVKEEILTSWPGNKIERRDEGPLIPFKDMPIRKTSHQALPPKGSTTFQ
jgi:hypothetical protein